MKKVVYVLCGVTLVIAASLLRSLAAGGSDMVMMGWVGSRTRRKGNAPQMGVIG